MFSCIADYSEDERGGAEEDESDTKQKDDSREIKTEESEGITLDEQLYREILFEILTNVEIGQTALISYTQDAFKVPKTKHRQLLAEAKLTEPPKSMVNVEVIEAKDLKPKDSNGLRNLLVTLYLASNTAHRCNSSVKDGLVWEEHFAFPLSTNSTGSDTLCLEVWDLRGAELVEEKSGRFSNVKGLKGMKKLVKKITKKPTTQRDSELIGGAEIPLRTIPASGTAMWYSLDERNTISATGTTWYTLDENNRTPRGAIKIRISFSSEKNHQVAQQEHRHMLRILLLHELQMSKVAQFWWSGTFSKHGEALLTQHITQSGLAPTEVAMCQWSVFTSIHQTHQLNFTLFSRLLDELLKPLQTKTVGEENEKLFWEGVKQLLPSCFSIIRKIRKKDFKEQQLIEVLNILRDVKGLEQPSVDLFPSGWYSWVSFSKDSTRDVLSVVDDAVKKGADDWFNLKVEGCKKEGVGWSLNLIRAVEFATGDLQQAEFFDKLFQEKLNFHYIESLYIFYQAKISALAEPEVKNFCQNLKKPNFTGFTTSEVDASESLTEGTSLFDVYLALHRFVMLGQELCQTDFDSFHICNYYEWFHGGVVQWLDLAVFKALERIEKAVELDTLVPVDPMVKYSSSAVDTLTIFYQVKMFWKQLNWPNVEDSYTLIAKIIDDICSCCVFYAEKMAIFIKVEEIGADEDVYEKNFEVTNECCLAINNIEYVRQSLQPLTEELGVKEVIEKLSGNTEAKHCLLTLNNVIAQAVDTVQNEIISVLEALVKKMGPSMKRLLMEAAELFNQDINNVDRLMLYINNNLRTLYNELNQENFNRVLEIIWDNIEHILQEIIHQNLEKFRPPSFFSNLHKILDLITAMFRNFQENFHFKHLNKMETKLKMNGLETSDLIHSVHLQLYEDCKQTKNSKFGEVGVKVKFEENNLKMSVLNARNLIAMDSNGDSDAFVRIRLLPEHKFPGIPKPKTRTQYKTLSPDFNESFTLNLPPDFKEIQDGLVLFSVKYKDLFGDNQYIGEAFLHFDTIQESTTPLENMNQLYLPLIRPTDLSCAAVVALEHRQDDQVAREFLRKFRQRMGCLYSRAESTVPPWPLINLL